MANITGSAASLDKWRDYFRRANSDIFDIIKHAIMVAASDCPYDFKLNRDRIAEMLFTCKSTTCFGCDRIELALPNDHEGMEKSDDKYISGIETGDGSKDTKESKANSSRDDDNHREIMKVNRNQVSNCSYGDAEALTDEMDEESHIFGEVLSIKEIIDNSEEQSDSMLIDSLTRLQLTPLSIETLKATEIGKSVNSLRKHGSKNIRNLVRTLVEDWKNMVDEFYLATSAIAGAEVTPESGKKSVVEEEGEEEGLPSPPLDEAAFFSTPSAMELSQFFDGMDDDGNIQNSGKFNKNRDNGRRPNVMITDVRKPEPKKKKEAMFKEVPSCKPNRHYGVESMPGRSKPPSGQFVPGRPKPVMQFKAKNEVELQQMRLSSIQKKQAPPKQEKLICNDEASVRLKLDAAKRKLQERYQEAENAKKQRTIQVVELRDLPKQSVAQRNQNMRPGNHNKHWANNRM